MNSVMTRATLTMLFVLLCSRAFALGPFDAEWMFEAVQWESDEQAEIRRQAERARKLAELESLQQRIDLAASEGREDRDLQLTRYHTVIDLGYHEWQYRELALSLADSLLTTSTLSTPRDRNAAIWHLDILGEMLPSDLATARRVAEQADQYIARPAAKQDFAFVYRARGSVQTAYRRAGDIQMALKININIYGETIQLLSNYRSTQEAITWEERQNRFAVGDAFRSSLEAILRYVREDATRRDVRYLLSRTDLWKNSWHITQALVERGFLVVDTAEWNRLRSTDPNAEPPYMPSPEVAPQ